jgi:hypothetical protein
MAQRDSIAMMTASASAAGIRPNTSRQRALATLEPFTRGFYVNDMAREASRAKSTPTIWRPRSRKIRPDQRWLNANIQPT